MRDNMEERDDAVLVTPTPSLTPIHSEVKRG